MQSTTLPNLLKINNLFNKIMIKIGIKPGRISNLFFKKYKNNFEKKISRNLKIKTKNKKISFYLINEKDINFYFKKKIIEFYILGLDSYLEQEMKFKYFKINIFKCALFLIRRKKKVKTKSNKIITKYIKTVKKNKKLKKHIYKKLNGSIETCLITKICRYIIDIVDTGKTVKKNKLKIIKKIKSIYSILLINKKAKKSKIKTLKKFFKRKC